MKVLLAITLFSLAATPGFAASVEKPVRILALGDSLIAGYGLPVGQDYATQLEIALKKEDYNVTVINAGVTGDTTAGGLARLDALLATNVKPDKAIVALGANDMFRGVPPETVKRNLRTILQTLKNQKIPTVLYGMKAPFNADPAYRKAFDKIYPDLADEFDIELYPFFLKGVALDPRYTINDGVHPNQQGIAIMVKETEPLIEDLLDD